MRRPLLAGLAAVLALALPAGAIETDAFGIEATRESAGRHLRTVVRPGGEVTEQLLVWNKTGEALRLDLSVVSARIPRRGAPELGVGDPSVTEWVSVAPEAVTLDAGEERLVTVTMDAPDDAPRRSAVAVLATPRTTGAILKRLGIVIDLRRGGPAGDSTAGLVLWVVVLAVAALALAAGALRLSARRSRGTP